VLDRREGIVEMMQEFAPAFVLGRPAKTFGVALEAVPVDEQKVSMGILETSSKFVA
jgi:hypothetical protein